MYDEAMPGRKYEQRLRAEAAELTRRHILDAAYERMRSAPSEPLAVDLVAKLAGVARSTVYLIFGSRSGLFDAIGQDLLERGGFRDLIREVDHPDVREGLRRGIRAGAVMYAANRDVLRALFSMASLDADSVGGAVQRMEQGRAEGMALLARRLGDGGLLQPDVTEDEATDALYVLTSFEAFDLLHSGRCLSVEETAERLTLLAKQGFVQELHE